jgi:ferredoxin
MTRHRIEFSNGAAIEVNEGEKLSESLDVTNSPILFGCRTGICATCLVEVIEGMENLPPISEDEEEVLEIYADQENCRLSCQLHLTGPAKLAYIGK